MYHNLKWNATIYSIHCTPVYLPVNTPSTFKMEANHTISILPTWTRGVNPPGNTVPTYLHRYVQVFQVEYIKVLGLTELCLIIEVGT